MNVLALANVIHVGPAVVIGAAVVAGIIGIWLAWLGRTGSSTPWVHAAATMLAAGSLLGAAGSRSSARASAPLAGGVAGQRRVRPLDLLSNRAAGAVNCAVDAAVPLLLVSLAMTMTHS